MNASTENNLPGTNKIARTVGGIVQWLGVLFIVSGLLLAIGGCRRSRAAKERTQTPVTLRSGERVELTFRTAGLAELMIDLVVPRFQGVRDDGIDDALFNPTNPVTIGWTVARKGTELFSGVSTNIRPFSSGSADAKTIGIGRFNPGRRGTYQFTAHIHSSHPELTPASPSLRITPHIAFRKQAGIAGSLGIFGSVLLSSLGCIVVLLGRREWARGTTTS